MNEEEMLNKSLENGREALNDMYREFMRGNESIYNAGFWIGVIAANNNRVISKEEIREKFR